MIISAKLRKNVRPKSSFFGFSFAGDEQGGYRLCTHLVIENLDAHHHKEKRF